MFPISDSIPSRHFPILTMVLIVVTAYVFFLQLTTPDPEGFIRMYAMVPSQINWSDFSTFSPFVTAIFLHGGFLHILSNLWFLWVFGDNVEDNLGFLGFPLLYFVSGIAGNLLQYITMPGSDIPALGASGAIAGVLGAYYVLFPHAEIKTFVPIFGFFTFLQVSAPFMLGYWFLLQVFSGAVSFGGTGESGGIAFFAHIGGFIAGFLLAKIIGRRETSYAG